MKNGIELFAELGRRLASFGQDAESRDVLTRACEVNGWFDRADICRAIDALRLQMLQPTLLSEWLSRYPLFPVNISRNVLVIMAGNIPLVGFFDLLCVLLSGHACLVKPSAKDRVMMEYVIDLLRTIEPELSLEFYLGQRVDAVIATGSDETERYFRNRFAGIPSLLRGSRYSAAVLSGHESVEQLHGLSDDIFAYSGLGCRSVSLIFIPRGYELKLEIPDLNPKYLNNYRQRKTMLAMTGCEFRDLGGILLTHGPGFPSVLSEISCVEYENLCEVAAWLDANDRQLQCVVTACISHSRHADFGRAQAPLLTDYPDGKDVMEFLSGI